MRSRTVARTPVPFFPQPTTASIAARIRTLRRERGWSLRDIEILSKGSIKAVVLGSYERSDRAMSLNRAIELANLYSVPLGHLLCPPEETPDLPQTGMMFDLRKAQHFTPEDAIGQTITTFLAWISGRRSDWNGEVLSLRQSDLSTLALMTFTTEVELLDWLYEKKVLVTALSRP